MTQQIFVKGVVNVKNNQLVNISSTCILTILYIKKKKKTQRRNKNMNILDDFLFLFFFFKERNTTTIHYMTLYLKYKITSYRETYTHKTYKQD